jgi:hypothetical protein
VSRVPVDTAICLHPDNFNGQQHCNMTVKQIGSCRPERTSDRAHSLALHTVCGILPL